MGVFGEQRRVDDAESDSWSGHWSCMPPMHGSVKVDLHDSTAAHLTRFLGVKDEKGMSDFQCLEQMLGSYIAITRSVLSLFGSL